MLIVFLSSSSVIFFSYFSYGRDWEAFYKEGNEDEGILILRFFLLLFLLLFLEIVQFC